MVKDLSIKHIGRRVLFTGQPAHRSGYISTVAGTLAAFQLLDEGERGAAYITFVGGYEDWRTTEGTITVEYRPREDGVVDEDEGDWMSEWKGKGQAAEKAESRRGFAARGHDWAAGYTAALKDASTGALDEIPKGPRTVNPFFVIAAHYGVASEDIVDHDDREPLT